MKAGMRILVLAGVLLSGVLAAWVCVRAGGARMGWYLFPFVLCVDMFAFSTVCFFLAGGKREILYGICSMLCAACAIVQLGILF